MPENVKAQAHLSEFVRLLNSSKLQGLVTSGLLLDKKLLKLRLHFLCMYIQACPDIQIEVM